MSRPAFDDKCIDWLSNVYHCCESWGNKETEETMLLMLTETIKEKDPEDYSPDPSLYRECMEYWNKLCDVFPE